MKLKKQLYASLNKTTNRLRLILGDQLNINHSWFKEKSPKVVYVIAELYQEMSYTTHHIQKIAGFFSAMQHFAKHLADEGHQVIYLTLDETSGHQSLEALLSELIRYHAIQYFDYQRPDEYRLLSQLEAFSCQNVNKTCFESEHFMLPFNEINQFFNKNKSSKMELFYRKMRTRFNILLEEDGKPLGGKWNYDAENRSALKSSDLDKIPAPKVFKNNVSPILRRLAAHQIKTIGECDNDLFWPVTREQSLELLKFFCHYLLINFGKFQDAMTQHSEHKWSLYHSRLSFALNVKLISPAEVIQKAIQYWSKHQDRISLSQIEGFVRQILGWREFVRGIYWINMPEYGQMNFLEAKRPLPGYFWTGDTKMNCLKHAIGQSLEKAYAHHIQRLMITGNFALLCGIDPDEVDQWYLGIYVDAIEWVEMPNTRGMTQFADGGILATKPYAASGSYVNKMSDYCKGCFYNVKHKAEQDACPLNSLYWNFVNQHSERFKSNPRMTMVYNSWKKMATEKQNQLLNKAQQILINIENL